MILLRALISITIRPLRPEAVSFYTTK